MSSSATDNSIRLFMVGDVMLARGIDMLQSHSCDPILYEKNGMNANDYVSLAVSTNGPLPERRDHAYVWGDAIKVLEEKTPDARIINLETSITTNDSPWPGKGIHYRMHPANVEVIKAAKIDCCALANNHTADWGFKGLEETVRTLKENNMSFAGAGANLKEAKAPAIIDLPRGKGRILVFSGGHHSSGIPEKWRATADHGGLYLIDIHQTSKATSELKELVSQYKRDGDIVVLSVHWGGNWGFELEPFSQKFAHAAIKEAGVDIVHGHSSHHVKGIEVYKGKLIIYGCGDFLNDYEGITGYETYRGDLALMYFADVEQNSGKLLSMKMVPTQTKQLRVNFAQRKDMEWLQQTMSKECKKLNCDTKVTDNELQLVFKK